MKIAIIGAGAMGSLLGFYLSKQAEVWLLDPWAAHVASIRLAGITCERDGTTAVQPCHATSDPVEIGRCDAIIVLVKAAQTSWAAAMAAQLIGNEGRETENDDQGDRPSSAVPRLPSIVYTLQNGVGNREQLAEHLGAARVGQGVTSLGATLLGPGRVRHAGIGPTIFSAEPSPSQATDLAALFSSCGLPAEVSADLDGLVWGKLLANVAINALTALLRVPNGTLAEVPAARELAEAAVVEAVAVAAARGTSLPYSDPVGHALAVAATTGANRSSMLQDVLRGAPSEIATINGAVSREGRRLGVPTPVNDLLTALVSALDATIDRRVVT